MEKLFASVEDLTGHLKEYIQNYREYVQLSVAESVSRIASYIMASILMLFCFSFFALFGSIALAYLLGAWMGHFYLGFLLVSVFYLLFGIVIWSVKEKVLQLPLMNSMIKQLSKQENHEDQ